MKINTNGTEYEITRDSHCWTLRIPTVVIDRDTKKEKRGFTDAYYATTGQCLAAICERELGNAADIAELKSSVDRLRKDLLEVKP